MADNENGGAGAGAGIDVANLAPAAGAGLDVANAAPAAAAAAPAAVVHRIDEWRRPVEDKLLAMLSYDAHAFECVKKLLRDTGSLIAGGGILNAIQPFPGVHDSKMSSKDLDIYVPAAQIPVFIERIGAADCLGADRVKQIEASLYCKSFLRKNGIRKIYTLTTKHKLRGKPLIFIDIMSVRNKRTPLAVVNNFDLTFCQVWYDGEAVYASHPDHIREKKGFMSAEYIPTFLAGNRFLARRTNKYIQRGFTILPDPASPGLAEIFQKLPDQLKLMKGYKFNEQTNEQLRKWMNHTLLKIAKQNVDIMDSIYRFDPANYYPVIPGNVSRRAVPDFIFTKNLHDGLEYRDSFYSKTYAKSSSILGSAPFAHVINKIRTDGYDSDDLINERATFNDKNNDDEIRENYIKNDIIKADIIGKYYTDSPDDLVFTMEGNVRRPNPSDDLKYHRAMTRILIHSLGVDYTEVEDDHQLFNFNGTFRHIINKLKGIDMPDEVDVSRLARNQKYAEAMKLFMTRYGEDMMGFNGPVFDIHNHPMEGAITQEGLEGYCETHIADIDKTEVPCYWQPEPGNSPKNCKHKLKLEEVRAIVSDKFYERYAKPAPIKTGLNQIVPAYDIVFSDKKSRNAVWGDIFGKGVCPFCLQVENRESGCAYMEHSNPSRLPPSHAPFCQKHFKTPIWETYRQQAVQLLGAEGIPEHLVELEFCIECGRPCANHRHFDLNNPPGLLPAADPGRCTGGGRPELYARISAIREIYGTLEINVPAEERAIAAADADGAARDPAYIARGRAIFEKAEAERKWNINVPAHKNYNNDAYRAAPRNEADEKENEDNSLPNLNGGARRRRTYKKRKGSKFTRKMN